MSTPTVESTSFTSAVLKAQLDPGDEQGYYSTFEFAELPSEFWSGCFGFESFMPAGSGSEELEKELTGLTPGTEYAVRLCALGEDFLTETRSPEPNPTFTTEAVAPPAVTIESVTTFTGTTATFEGSVNPEAAADDPAFDANWHFECTPACPGLQGGIVQAGDGEQQVEAQAEGLEPNTDYEVNLVATNAGGAQSAGPASFTTDAVAPEVQTLYGGEITDTTAVLAASVNPRNAAAAYQFEWGTEGNLGELAPAVPTPIDAEDNDFHIVTAPVQGLEPGMTYEFRIVATNSASSESHEGSTHSLTTLEPESPASGGCPNQEIRAQQHAEAIGECRAFEQVSPVEKDGGAIAPWGSRSATPDGDDVLYNSLVTALPGAPSGGPSASQAHRDPVSGWSSHFIGSPMTGTGGKLPSFNLVAPGNDAFVVRSYKALAPGALEGGANLYRRDAAGAYTLLAPVPGESTIFATPGATARGASADFKDIFFNAFEGDQTGESPPSQTNVYEWSEGQVHLMDVLPDGSIAPNGALIGTSKNSLRAVSRDGNRVAYHTIEPSATPQDSNRGQLYVRDDAGTATTADDTTVHISASQRSTPDPAGTFPADYLTAEAEHGDAVLFTSCEKLTDDSTAFDDSATSTSPTCRAGVVAANSLSAAGGRDLYRYDLTDGELSDLTTADPRGASVSGVIGASDDLSRVYFVARGALDPSTDDERFGEQNLYLYEEGETHFIATLADEDLSGDIALQGRSIDSENWSGYAGSRTAMSRVSANGSQLLFTSHRQLTSFDNRSPIDCAGAPPATFDSLPFNPEERCLEVYRYAADTGQIACLSCPDHPQKPLGDAALAKEGAEPIGQEPPTNIAAGGTKFFFQTPDSLTSADSNGKLDVYVWAGGRASLVSSGRGGTDSFFADSTPPGDDVFIVTGDRLASADRDTARDLYDARIDGGFAEPIAPPACEGDACLPPPVVPTDLTPASAGTSGGREIKPTRACPKHKVRRGNRCVKRKRPKRHASNDKHGRTGR